MIPSHLLSQHFQQNRKNRVNTCSSNKKEKTLPSTVKSIGVRNGIDLQTRVDPPQKKGKKMSPVWGRNLSPQLSPPAKSEQCGRKSLPHRLMEGKKVRRMAAPPSK
ncbi:hypothetical protein TNCV_4598071 [Trichonephila clavipes]|nr:hypothetical protein TNCV_4598071 [Trichonephila clavipes]